MSTTNLHEARAVCMIGAKGTGMSGLAYLLHAQEKSIFAFDASVTDESGERLFHGVHVYPESMARERLSVCDLCIITDAVQPGHTILDACKQSNVPVLRYHEALGDFARDFTTIAVTGTHGKSTTTAFLAKIMMDAGMDPSVLLGAKAPFLAGGNAHAGDSQYFIVEADEYRGHFLELSPLYEIIVNIDFDHPDYFVDMGEVEHAYAEFLRTCTNDGFVVTHEHVRSSHPSIPWPDTTTVITDTDVSNAPQPLPGTHMQYNAALAIRLAQQIGVDREKAVRSLTDFPGLERRMELIGTMHDALRIYSDYGHHPAEIRATLEGAQDSLTPPIHVVFELHMNERLDAFFDAFVDALSLASHVVLYPPFLPPGREHEPSHHSIDALGRALSDRGVDVVRIDEAHDLADVLASRSGSALAFSAGNLDADMRTIAENGSTHS